LLTPDPVFDAVTIDGLVAIADGDETFLPDLFDTYRKQSAAIVEFFACATAAADRKGVGRAAHALAGASLNIGAAAVAAVCSRIENLMADPAARPAESDVNEVRGELARLDRAIAAGWNTSRR
jgi:HPt (histidine-containing phosphotransfer) domain-containing protein